MFDLSHKTILVTGAAGHLGTAIAHALSAADATVILVGRNEDTLNGLRDRLEHRDKSHLRVTDLSDAADVQALIAWIGGNFDRLDGIVNNAYGGKVGPVAAIEAQDFRRASTLNVEVPFTLVRDLAPLLKRSAGHGTSSVVNVGSMYGKVSPDPKAYGDTGWDNPVHYGATKAALLQMTRYLACNLDPSHIRINSVSPGPFPNPEKNSDAFLRTLSEKVPMGRTGRAHEIAGPILFLLSDASSYMNGADIAVDGGWTAW